VNDHTPAPPTATRRTAVRGALALGLAPLLLPGRAEAAPRALVRARRKHFGAANVDRRTGAIRRDRVLLSWIGCAGFALAIDGEVLLLDAWIPRGIHGGRVPTSVAELAALRPRAILIGHGHFDHAADAHRIAELSGAVVVGTAQHITQVRAKASKRIRGLVVGDERDPHGTVRRARLGSIRLTAVRHPHSTPKPPDLSDPHLPLLPLPDPLTPLLHPPSLADCAGLLTGLAGDAEGGSLLYQLRVPGFTLVWHDTVGPLKEDAPRVRRVLRRLPRPDVHVGAIQGFGQITNGLRDVRHYVADVGGTVFVPSHHDDWGAPLIASPASGYRGPLEAELRRIPAARRPHLRFLSDPHDYLRADRLTFSRRRTRRAARRRRGRQR